MIKTYCMNCQKEITEEINMCECGSRSFITGNLLINDNGFACTCGNKEVKNTAHMDATDRAINKASCTKCGAMFDIVWYRDAESMAYWE